MKSNDIYIYIYRFGTYLGSGITVQYDFGTTRKINIYNVLFLFIYFEQTVVLIFFFVQLYVKILIIIISCYIYKKYICNTFVFPPILHVIKLHILEWPFIVASLRHTCPIIMLSNQHLDMLHL